MPKEPDRLDPETREALDLLEEALADYERYVRDIGHLGLAAPQLLYYRSDVQDMLDLLADQPDLDLAPYWARVRDLDNVLRARAADLVEEIGHANFKQYQIINDPPQMHWWWYLNRLVPAPRTQVRGWWEFWKR
jgi:hypothetical protein